jgi:hypothetical protein
MFLHFNIELLLYFINPMCYIYSTLQLLSISYYIVLQYVLCSTDIAFFFLSILQDCDIVDRCLTAINALASYHFKERLGGRGGLSSQLMESEGSNGKLQESISSHFLRLLLQLLLFEDFRMELAGSAADALLPLILCEQPLYQVLSVSFCLSVSENRNT